MQVSPQNDIEIDNKIQSDLKLGVELTPPPNDTSVKDYNCDSTSHQVSIDEQSDPHTSDANASSLNSVHRVKRDTLKLFNSLTDDTRKHVAQTWTLLYKARDQLCMDFQKSIYSDEDLLSNEDMMQKMSRIQTSVVIDTYNRFIKMMCSEDTCFDELVTLLTTIGKVHIDQHVAQPELLLARKHILKVIKHGLGATFNNDIKQAWIDFSGFITAGLMTAYKEYDNRNPEYLEYDTMPDWQIWEMCKESWRWVEDENLFDSLCLILWKRLSSVSEDMLTYFPDMGQIPQLKYTRQLLNISADHKNLIESLEDLGRMHVKIGVTKNDFLIFRDAFFEALNECLGLRMHTTWAEMTQCHMTVDNETGHADTNGDVDNDTTVGQAWWQAFSYISFAMIRALEDQWLLELPPDPIEMSLNIQINHIDHIDPTTLRFYGDISFIASDGNANPTMTAFHDKHNIAYDRYKLEFLNSVTNKNNSNKNGGKELIESKTTKNESTNFEDLPPWNVDIVNTIKSDTTEIYRANQKHTLVRNVAAGIWYQRGHIKGSFSQYFDLHHFPVDRHVLEATFVLDCSSLVAKFSSQHVRVKVQADSSSKSSFGGTEYDVLQPYCEVRKSGSQHLCVLKVPIQRRWKHMLYHVFVPLSLIESVAFITYNMNIQPIFHRMSVLVALVLALFTFKWTVDKAIPPVPYMTNLDYHFFLSFLFLFANVLANGLLTAVSNSFAHSLHTISDEEAAMYIAKGNRANFAMFFVIFAAFTTAKSIIVYSSYKYYAINNEFDKTIQNVKYSKRHKLAGPINQLRETSQTEASVNESITNTATEWSKTDASVGFL